MERIQLRKQLIKCCVFAISQLVIVSGTFILKSEKAEAAGNNLAISIANDYVNIRNKPSLNGKVKGRLIEEVQFILQEHIKTDGHL